MAMACVKGITPKAVGVAGDEPPEAEMPVMLRQQHILQKEIKSIQTKRFKGSDPCCFFDADPDTLYETGGSQWET
jgi:hypothetical protein